MASKSAEYYRKNPRARKKKSVYDKKLNATTKQKKKRADCNRKRRAAKRAGKNIKNMDYDHGSKRFISSSKNRGKKSGTSGDKRARGGGKRKKSK